MAAVELFANNPSTTVSSGGTTAPSPGTVETWTVAPTAAFPAAATGVSQFHVADPAADTELIAVTNVSGTTWTVTRGAESTTPVAHLPGFIITQVVSAGGLGTFAQAGQGDLGGTGSAPTVAKIQGTTVATPPGGVTQFLRGDGTWAVPPAAGGTFEVVIAPSGDLTGATDTTNLQSALTAARTAGQGRVHGQAGGVFYLNAQLTIGSGTTLDMRDCTINEVASTNRGFVKNFATIAVASAADASISSGSSTITTSLGASAVVGQSVTVAGAAAVSGLLFCGLVSGSTSNTITVTNLDGTALTAGTTVSSAAVALYTRDSNITIVGGYWQAGSNQPNVIGNFRIGHCDHYTVDLQGFSSTIAGYTTVAFDITDGVMAVRNLNTTTTGSDGIHVAGPCYGLLIPEVTGTCGDDVVSLTASDYPGGTTTGETSGNITGVKIGTIDATTSEASLKLIAGAGNFIDDVKVYGTVRGNSHNGIWVGDDVNQASTTGGTYGYIDLGRVAIRNSNTALIFLRSPAARMIKADISYYPSGVGIVVNVTGTSTVTIENLVLTGNATFQSSPLVFVSHKVSNVTITHLVLDSVNLDSTTGTSALVSTSSGAQIGTIDFIACHNGLGAHSNGYALLVAGATDVVSTVNFTGGTYTCLNLVSDASTAAMTVTFTGGITSSTSNVVGVGVASGGTSTKTYVFAGCSFTCNGSNPAFLVNRATVVFKGDNMLLSAAGGMLSRVQGTESVEAIGTQLPLDLSQLIRTGAGDMANNTNGALACGTGPAISSGSGSSGSWKNLFSGSTY